MSTKLPADAFETYYNLGPGRSYSAVAKRFGVAKRTVTRTATKENWQRLVEERDHEVRRAAAKRTVETLDDLNARHLKMLRAVQGKAIEALKALPMNSAMDAIRAIDLSIKQERLIRGEPTEHTAVDTRQVEPGPPLPEGAELGSYVLQLVDDAKQDGLLEEGDSQA